MGERGSEAAEPLRPYYSPKLASMSSFKA